MTETERKTETPPSSAPSDSTSFQTMAVPKAPEATAENFIQAVKPALEQVGTEQQQLLNSAQRGFPNSEADKRVSTVVNTLHSSLKAQGIQLKDLSGTLADDGKYLTSVFREKGLHLEIGTYPVTGDTRSLKVFLNEIDQARSITTTIKSDLLKKLGVTSEMDIPVTSIKKEILSIPPTPQTENVLGRLTGDHFGNENVMIFEDQIAQIAKASGQTPESLRQAVIANEASQLLLIRSLPNLNPKPLRSNKNDIDVIGAFPNGKPLTATQVVEAFSDYSSLKAGLDAGFYIKHITDYSTDANSRYELSHHILNKSFPEMSKANPPILSKNNYKSADELVLDIRIRGQSKAARSILIQQFENDLAEILTPLTKKP